MRIAETLCLLTLASGMLAGAQLGCDSTMKSVKGCGADSECPMGTICRASDGRCVTPPPSIKVEVVLSGDGSGTVTSSPAGITCGATCSGSFVVGQKATLTATPAAGSKVAGFSIGCTSQTTTCDLTPDGTIDPLRVMVNFGLDSTAPPPALCNEYGFCWENPRPLGNRLRRLIVPSQGELWAVGDAGTVLRRSGGSFSLIPTGTDRNLNAIWGSSASDHFVVGDAGTVLRFATTAYTPESGASGNLFDVYGGTGTLFAVGSGGTIVRRSGAGTWSADSSGTSQDLWGVWGTSTAALTAVGGAGTYTRSPAAGTTWTSAVEAAFSAYTFRGYTGSGTTGYAVDSFGGIARYTGTWTQVYRDALADVFYGIGIVGGTPYTAGGNPGGTGAIRRFDGTTWVRDVSLAPNTFYGIAGSGATDIWAVGEGGTVWQNDGSSWQARSSGLTANFAAIAAFDTQTVWAVGVAGSLLRYNGSYFTPVNIGASGFLNGVAAITATDAWTVGSGGQTWHYLGSTWTQADSKTTMGLNGVAGLSSNQVWAVGDGGTIRFFDGTSWQLVSSGSSATLRRVFAASASEIWAVGDGGIVQRSSGGAFTPVVIPGPVTANLYDVWGSGGAIWVLADNAVYRYAGGSWSTLPPPGVTGLRALSGTGPGDLWAVGLGGVIVRYNGSTWTREKSGAGTDLSSISISGTRVWISGSTGTVLRKIL